MIRLENVCFAYEKEIALRYVDLHINRGDSIVIQRPNGCGKSTLLSIIAGLEEKTEGEIYIEGEKVSGISPKIGYMLQRDCLLEWRNILSNTLFGLEVKGIKTKENIEYVKELLKKYNLYDFKNKYPSELSGGMRQRVALIRTLAVKPKILLLDEAFSALDYQTRIMVTEDIYSILRKEKINRGYIDFGIDEAKVIQDKKGRAIDIVKRVQGTGEKLIEDFMIAANETVATHISNMDLPFIYRVHDLPNAEKIEDFCNLIKQLGYQVHTNLNKITPVTMQKLLDEFRDKDEFVILSDMLLRSMKKAIYSTNNIGHFGLASKNYTHFTSPIRRFPDLTVHRLLRTYLFENRIDLETINFNAKYLIDVAEHSSETEVNSIEAERDVLDMKMAEYMEKHVGEEYDGIISGVTNFGLFVELDNLVEGLVHISTLNGFYTYVPEMLSLISSNKKKKYRIGDKVRIIVTKASKKQGIIDFELVGDNNGNNK